MSIIVLLIEISESQHLNITDGEIKHIEIKETMSRYTNDVIASTAFGYKINSFEDKSNKFYVMGKKATNFSGWQFMKFQAYAVLPSLMKVNIVQFILFCENKLMND